MSTFEEHEIEQSRITAECAAGDCDHPECHEDGDDITGDFPYEEIRKPDGDFFASWAEAKAAGYADNQIWSITESEGTWTYGPPHHFVNHIGHIATVETHDNQTYYHEVFDDDDEKDTRICSECGSIYPPDDSDFGICADCEDMT